MEICVTVFERRKQSVIEEKTLCLVIEIECYWIFKLGCQMAYARWCKKRKLRKLL
jgi:hypothetical protein